ncbi:hypothetical protein, partial [Klebsiella pneumoniae]|uniref:hypothetical protein n=1 Tax=Klebsiella pneumoniae TaxID=573 RepID=UPI001954B568
WAQSSIALAMGSGLSASLISVLIYYWADIDTILYFPFFKELYVDLGVLYLPFAVFVIVGLE